QDSQGGATHKKKGFNSIVILVAWQIWKHRNALYYGAKTGSWNFSKHGQRILSEDKRTLETNFMSLGPVASVMGMALCHLQSEIMNSSTHMCLPRRFLTSVEGDNMMMTNYLRGPQST
ncbi:hypothetical protein ACJX0J_015303, partial [Zea mays]